MEVKTGYKQTEVGVIPEDWEVAMIGDLASFTSGMGISVSSLGLQSSDTPIPVYGGNGIAGYTYKPIVQEPTVVIGRVGQKCGEVYLTEGLAWITDNALYPRNIHRKLDIRFFALALKAAGLNNVKNRNDLPLVTQAILSSVAIPFPPKLAEQEAIAEALSDADALIEALEQLITKKRQVKQGAMQELLTGKRRLPGFSDRWKRKNIKAIVQTPVTDGPHLTPIFLEDGFPFLSVNNIADNVINWSDLRYISLEDHQIFSKKCKPQRNDILFGKAASVGKVAIVETDLEFDIWSPIAMIRVSKEHNSKYVYYALQTRDTMRQIEILTNSSSQGNIGMGEIEKIEVALPSKEEQTAIAEILSDMDAEIAALEGKLSKAREVKAGMMSVLLTGKIRLVESGK